jgi:coenzyme F420-reducing hydrogenase delta subunit
MPLKGRGEEVHEWITSNHRLLLEHCAYAAADLAGGLRMQYPPAIKIVQLPCTGKLDTLMVLQALEAGADGVMVAG